MVVQVTVAPTVAPMPASTVPTAEERIAAALEFQNIASTKGVITAAQYQEITGMAYVAP